MRKQVDKAQGAFASLPLFPCFPVSLSTYLPVYQSKNTPPPAYCQGRGVDPRGTTLLEPKSGSALSLWPSTATARLITVASPGRPTTLHALRFTFHVPRFARPTPRPIRRRRGCLVHTLGGSLKPGSPLLARFTVVHISIGESMPQASGAVKQTGLKPHFARFPGCPASCP